MPLDSSLEQVDAATLVVKLTGRMTLGMRLQELEGQLNHAVDNGVHRLLLDVSGIEYADSAGLGLVMLLYGRMKKVQGSLRVVAPGPTLLQLFELTNTDKLLSIYPDLAAALAD
jgi:anti-sigma B factor antagonist